MGDAWPTLYLEISLWLPYGAWLWGGTRLESGNPGGCLHISGQGGTQEGPDKK